MISAIFEHEYNVDTKSWWLGTEVSYIEIDSKVNLTADQIAKVENTCNDLIAAATPVSVFILSDKNKSDIPIEVNFHCFSKSFWFQNVEIRFRCR